MKQIELRSHEAGILSRIVGLDESELSAAAARGILRLRFSDADKEHMHRLAAKARAGDLTDEEQAKIDAYSRIGSLIGILKSKARRALNRRAANGKPKTR
jgi:hypothetical protein